MYFNLLRRTFSPNCRCILYFSIVIELLLLKHSGSIRCEFGVNFSTKLGGPHHSAKFMNLARIQPNLGVLIRLTSGMWFFGETCMVEPSSVYYECLYSMERKVSYDSWDLLVLLITSCCFLRGGGLSPPVGHADLNDLEEYMSEQLHTGYLKHPRITGVPPLHVPLKSHGWVTENLFQNFWWWFKSSVRDMQIFISFETNHGWMHPCLSMHPRNNKPLKRASNPMDYKDQSQVQQKFQLGDLYSLKS